MADSYLDTITDPMDFRTIEDLRLDQYQHIHELQDEGRALRRSTRSIGNSGAGNETMESRETIERETEASNRSSRRVRGAASARDESQPTRHSSRSQVRRTYTEEESDQDEDDLFVLWNFLQQILQWKRIRQRVK
jgi:hypothetical protein